jgi:pimeloyl-ACP methyl ester carboxylesterase
MGFRSVRATRNEQIRPLPGDDLIPERLNTLSMTHAITIPRPPRDVWPWIVQMGAGSRGGWYSYDVLDNRHHRSVERIVPELQPIQIGMLFPALPGKTDGFTIAAFEPDQFLILDFKAPDGTRLVTWAFVLDPLDVGTTRLIVRARGRARRVEKRIMPMVHFIMQRKQLLGIAHRAEKVNRSAFRTSEGEAAYLAAYDAALKAWPVPYEEIEIPTRFGTTHVVASGPKDAPSLVLLHGYMATSTMWAPNIADFSKAHRVYAVDVMGQPSKSIPGEPIRDRADFAAWLTATLDALHLNRVSLAGMSYGGWIALGYAVAAPERVQKLVLLSAGGFLPMVKQFTMRGMLMVFWPMLFTVISFMNWLGIKENRADPDTYCMGNVVNLTYLGLKHFRMPQETARVMPTMFSDADLRSIQMPTLVLFGDHEVIYDPARALARARQLIPDCQGALVLGPRHEMCVSHHHIVDARVIDFLTETRTDDQRTTAIRSAA